MALALHDLMSVFSLEETVMIPVVLLSGDVLPVRIRPSDPIALFPKQFSDQHGFNPRCVHRFRFYTHLEALDTLDDEDAPLSAWRSIHHRVSGRWRDQMEYPSRLYLVIADDSEEDRCGKLSLIRSLLFQRGVAYPYDDYTLYSEYLSWWLRTQPTEDMENRYQILSAFVEEQYTLLHSNEMVM